MSNQIPLMDGEHSPALVVSITVMRNMLAGCQVVFGKGVTEQEAGDAEAAAVMALFEETYGKRQAVEADKASADPDQAIGEAMKAIEMAGAHPVLTGIVVALEGARKEYRTYISGESFPVEGFVARNCACCADQPTVPPDCPACHGAGGFTRYHLATHQPAAGAHAPDAGEKSGIMQQPHPKALRWHRDSHGV
ncbi:hypothetical protein [Methylobacterium sp. Leaf100]|uniref:hypothetical protein n=1 Tax=Methylobacterium sp. Leaf100 TaxID=1736252 RepID=UPI0006F9035E|nr:hypothetical protein [Methylobacterium sp. Leaf100]KQP31408.1 hypothetical protein ASF25_18450 [Methylobacterium sp. Leaf100]